MGATRRICCTTVSMQENNLRFGRGGPPMTSSRALTGAKYVGCMLYKLITSHSFFRHQTKPLFPFFLLRSHVSTTYNPAAESTGLSFPHIMQSYSPFAEELCDASVERVGRRATHCYAPGRNVHRCSARRKDSVSSICPSRSKKTETNENINGDIGSNSFRR